MIVTPWPIEKIIPYARNARNIPQAAVDKVASSIQEFGWRQPIVVDKAGVIIVGHVRRMAADKLGLPEAPVHVAENLTPAQVRAYRLLDNRSHEEATWDQTLLGLELIDLRNMGIDLDLTGFGMDEIDELLARTEGPDGLTDPAAVPEVPENPVTRTGDLWILGKHRLLCGDATLRDSFERILTEGHADMVFTDPPYNVNYKQPSPSGGGAARKVTNDNLGAGFEQFLADACRNMLAFSRGALYICMSALQLDTLKRVFVEAGGHWSTFIIWAKNTFTLGHSDYQRQFEPILYGWREGATRHWCGARDQGDVWQVNKPAANDLHPTQKPVELIERAILNSSKGGAIVLDPFAGSGSVLIACEKTGRRAAMIELEPGYVDTAVMRWQEFTGREALLEGDGRTYREIAEERGAPDARMPQ
jgi:DNA modification methylase